MSENEVISQAVVLFLSKDDGKQENTYNVKEVTCKDEDIVEEVIGEDDKCSKKAISKTNEEALSLEENVNKLSREKTVDVIVESVLC